MARTGPLAAPQRGGGGLTAPVAERYQREIDQGLSPIARWGEPADVGQAVATLATGGLPFSVGQVVYVDGGLSLKAF